MHHGTGLNISTSGFLWTYRCPRDIINTVLLPSLEIQITNWPICGHVVILLINDEYSQIHLRKKLSEPANINGNGQYFLCLWGLSAIPQWSELDVGFTYARSIVPALNKPLPEEPTRRLFSVETNSRTRLRGHVYGGFGMNNSAEPAFIRQLSQVCAQLK